MRYFIIQVICFTFVALINGHDIKGFDDSVLFDINWPGENTDDLDLSGSEHLVVTTFHEEKYKCILPNVQAKEENPADNYNGPMPFELLVPLFSQSSCSYRLESYWTYEICHGRFVRQYHEDREGKKVKLQEYYLGKWSKTYPQQLQEKLKVEHKEMQQQRKQYNVPMKKIDGINLPYFEITMENGSLCELNNNKPRQTKLLYVCYLHGKHEIFSFKETSTCQYEVIVLSPLLCSHPKFKTQETGEHQVYCLPLEGGPNKPYGLLAMKAETIRRKSEMEKHRVRVEFHPLDMGEVEATTKSPETPIDTSPVESFLAGKNCLNGGTGWWKYEFCYGKTVEQYHVEKDGGKISINLGRFNKEKHLTWIAEHPHKRPKPLAQRNQLSHFYSGGTVCDKTGKPRQTEIKLKCLENSANAGVVSLYLLEPRYCEYILGVESPLICDILQRADENGLVPISDGDDVVVEDDISLKIIKS